MILLLQTIMTKKKVEEGAEGPSYVGMHREQLEATIDGATTVEELDAIWNPLEGYGYSPEGRIAARVALRRSVVSGENLTDEQRTWIESVKLGDLLPTSEKE